MTNVLVAAAKNTKTAVADNNKKKTYLRPLK